MATPGEQEQSLQRRLARCEALPPAERTPEVLALLRAMQLAAQLEELLPRASGAAAAAVTREAGLRAMCKVGRPFCGMHDADANASGQHERRRACV